MLSGVYDEFKLGISFRIKAGQVIMQFSESVERIRMTAAGARKLAAMLTVKATELDRLGKCSPYRRQGCSRTEAGFHR